MKAMNEFNQRLDKNPVKLSDLTVGQTVLARVKITARKLEVQPVRIITTTPAPNTNNYPCLFVERMNGKQDYLYCRELDGETVVIDMTQTDRAKVTDWQVKEIKKLRAEQHALEARIETISKFK